MPTNLEHGNAPEIVEIRRAIDAVSQALDPNDEKAQEALAFLGFLSIGYLRLLGELEKATGALRTIIKRTGKLSDTEPRRWGR